MGILNKYYSIFFLVLSAFLMGCNQQAANEGTIVYDIEYPEMQENNFLIGLMPKKMVFHYKDNKFISILSAKADQLTIQLLGNSNSYEIEQTFKFGTQLIKSKLNKQEITDINLNEYGVITTNFTEETGEMIGFNTKKASIKGNTIGTQEVIFTEDIEFKDPNWSYPFPEVPGIPLQYQIDRMGLKMKLTAISSNNDPIDNSIFVLSDKYKSVDYSLFEKEIRTLLDSFMDLGS